MYIFRRLTVPAMLLAFGFMSIGDAVAQSESSEPAYQDPANPIAQPGEKVWRESTCDGGQMNPNATDVQISDDCMEELFWAAHQFNEYERTFLTQNCHAISPQCGSSPMELEANYGPEWVEIFYPDDPEKAHEAFIHSIWE